MFIRFLSIRFYKLIKSEGVVSVGESKSIPPRLLLCISLTSAFRSQTQPANCQSNAEIFVITNYFLLKKPLFFKLMKSLYQSDLRTLIIDGYGTGLRVSRILAHEFPAQTGMGPSRACPIGLRRSSPSPKPGPENRAQPGRAPGRPALCRPLFETVNCASRVIRDHIV